MAKVKVKLPLYFNRAPRHKSLLGSGGVAPHILGLGIRRRWVVSFTVRPLYSQGKSPWRGGWVGPIAGLSEVVKRNIPSQGIVVI